MDIVVLLAIGLVAGVFSGLFGIGGGIVIVPALTLLVGMSAKAAVATSAAAILLPSGIFAAVAYYRKGLLDVRAAVLVAVSLMPTTLVGAQITLALPELLFRQAYGLFVIVMGLRLLGVLSRKRDQQTAAGAEATDAPIPAWKLIVLGLLTGILSGMFGIGGGIVIVPMLMLYGMDQKSATGTSLATRLLPVGLPGVLAYYADGVLDIGAAVPVVVGLAISTLLGARIAIGTNPDTMRRWYGGFLLIVGIWTIAESLIVPG